METVAEIKALVEGHREQQQIDREIRIIDERISRTYEAIRDVASIGGSSVLYPYGSELIATIEELQKSLVTESSVTVASSRILSLEPTQIIAIVYKTIMDLTSKSLDGNNEFSAPANTVHRRIGSLVEVTARMNMMLYVKKGMKKPQDNTPLVRLAKEFGVVPAALSRWKGKQLHACMQPTKDTYVMNTGRIIWKAIEEILAPVVYHRKISRTGGVEMQFRIGLVESAVKTLEEEALDRAVIDASLGFMVCQPNALTTTSVNIRERYLTELVTRHADCAVEPSATTLLAANTTQNVPYTINQDVFNLLMTLSPEVSEKLVSLQDEPTEPNDGESQRQFESRVHNIGISNAAKRIALTNVKAAATEALSYDRIWFPVYLDFRGRQYTVDYKGLGPQATKNAKALLQLANGSPLGPNGLWWLYHELGNSMGWDKDLLEDKVAKAKALLPRMRGIVANPMSDTVWLEGDDPLKVYACMVDIVKAIDSGKPEEFVSHLICYVDGSCNGMQHLSLMTRDEVGAAATNVICPDGKRSDFYSVVGDRMLDALEDQYSDAAMYWKTTACEKYGMRKIAKRGVMTIPYGATHGGLAQQFVEDGFCTTKEFSHKGTQAESFVIRDALEIAMDGAAPKAMALRAWMLEAVSAVCKAGQHPKWTTPTGTVINHVYMTPRMKQVRIGDYSTNLPDFSGKGAKVNVKKNRSGIVANLIHSFDAAMLQDTMVRMVNQGVDNMSFVHDSYGAGAGSMEMLSRTLRESAVDIYSVDQIAMLHANFEQQAGCEISKPPHTGDLNVQEILDAEYFFA